MAALGEYGLYWASAPRKEDSVCEGRLGQYVFATQGDEPLAAGLRRARSVTELVRALAGGGGSGERAVVGAAVAFMALLSGNLIATGRWRSLLGFGTVGVVLAIWEMRTGLPAILVGLVGLFGDTVWEGEASLEWLVTVALTVVLALLVLTVVMNFVQEDSRGYVLLRETNDPVSRTVLTNSCCMDVKLLVFDGADAVRLVPQGGLLGGVLVPRGASHELAGQPPYVVKVYAPWERELGAFEVTSGTYSFQATLAPLVLAPARAALFQNKCQETVAICTTAVGCWTCSLWLPFAPLFARLVWPSQLVAPDGKVELPGPCMLRVYGSGLLGPLAQRASCMVRQNESAEYFGSVRWTGTPTTVKRTSSSVLSAVR